MKRLSIALCILLLFALTSFATSPITSNASLKGTYVFWGVHDGNNMWGQNLTCGGNPVFMGGNEVRPNVVMAIVTLDGAGNITSGTFTEYGKLDQNASNATVSCASNGNAVYSPPTSGTVTGSYSVGSNGTGTMTVTPSTPLTSDTFNISLVGNCASTGVNDAALLFTVRSDNSVENYGMMRLQ